MTKEENKVLKDILNEIQESKKAVYRSGITIEGNHFDLYIFVIGPIHINEKPSDCEFKGIFFPGRFYTVHISHAKDQKPVNNTVKYYCKSYSSAIRLAEKIKVDKGIEIKNLSTTTNDANLDEDVIGDYGKSYTQYGGGQLEIYLMIS